MEKIARIRQCLKRAGLPVIPSGNAERLALYGFDSLLAVLTVIELQKEFGRTICAEQIRSDAFTNIETLSQLIPD